MIRAVVSSRSVRVDGVKWPTEFAALPRVGDFVQEFLGDISAEVRLVTHAVDSVGPLVLVELA